MDVYTLTHATVMTALGVTVLLLMSGTVLAVSWLATHAVSWAWDRVRDWARRRRDKGGTDSPAVPDCATCLVDVLESRCPTCQGDFETCRCGVRPRIPQQTCHEED
jgi:hypothetical protein